MPLWNWQPPLENATGNYTPLLVHEDGTLSLFSNTDGKETGSWFVRRGVPPRLGEARKVIDASELHDQPGRGFIRTTAVVRSGDHSFHALLHVGHGYPSPTGYVPALATSTDGENWVYQGKIRIEGDIHDAYASGGNLLFHEQGPANVDHARPLDNRFAFFDDTFAPDGRKRKLVLIYSADAQNWFFHRFPDGAAIEAFPGDRMGLTNDSPVFPAACRTPHGLHLITGDRYPCEHHRHFFTTDSQNWTLIEQSAETFAGYKGTNLAYDPETGLIHAVTAGYQHLTLEAQDIR